MSTFALLKACPCSPALLLTLPACSKSSSEGLSLRQQVQELEYGKQVAEVARGQLASQVTELEGYLKEERK